MSGFAPTWEDNFVRIVYERGHQDFFDRFMIAQEVEHLLIVSPWITCLVGETIELDDVVAKIRKESIRTSVFMRSVKKEHLNLEALEKLKKCPTVTIYFNDELHAKVYVCKCSPVGFALLGSANLSGKATRAHEIGILIEGKGKGVEIVDELENLGLYDLPGRSGTAVYNRVEENVHGY